MTHSDPPCNVTDSELATPWDVVVIGAGPAGAVTAYLLARRNRRVLLVESKAFPRHKVCGGCLNARAVSLLQEMELDEVLQQVASPKIRHLQLRQAGLSATLNIPTGRAITRKTFDASLVAAACAAGAAFLPLTRAVVPVEAALDPREGALRAVRLQRSDSSPLTVNCRAVVAADGLLHPSLQELPALHSQAHPRAYLGIGAVIPRQGWPVPAETICMCLGRNGYVGIVEVEEDQINLAGALSPAALHGDGGVAAAVREILAEAGAPPLPGHGDADWHGTPALTRRCKELADRRLFVIGDAAGYVEPFTGEGMTWAIHSAVRVLPLLERACQAWDMRLIDEWSRTHQRWIGRSQLVCRGVSGLLRRPTLSRLAFRVVQRFPQVAAPFYR